MNEIRKIDDFDVISVISSHGTGELDQPFAHEIFLIEARIAGTTHVPDIADLAPDIIEGTRLSFFREPENEFDPLAILIKDEKGHKIGYIPRQKNEILAHLMDAGKFIYGIVKSREWDDDWLKIQILVYMND